MSITAVVLNYIKANSHIGGVCSRYEGVACTQMLHYPRDLHVHVYNIGHLTLLVHLVCRSIQQVLGNAVFRH